MFCPFFNCLSIISFMDPAFGGVPKKSSPNPRLFRFYPTLSSRSFIVLQFTFRGMIYCELIFLEGCKIYFYIHFFCFACGCPVVPELGVEELLFSLLFLCYFWQSSDNYFCVGLFLENNYLLCIDLISYNLAIIASHFQQYFCWFI